MSDREGILVLSAPGWLWDHWATKAEQEGVSMAEMMWSQGRSMAAQYDVDEVALLLGKRFPKASKQLRTER